MEVQPEEQPSAKRRSGRAHRTIGLAAASIAVVVVVGLVYLRSNPTSTASTPGTPSPPPSHDPVTYSFSFVTPTLGWAVLNPTNPPSGPVQFRVFRTTDGAHHWRLQFTGQGSSPGFAHLIVHFFDSAHAFMQLDIPSGGELVYRTSDGGNSWQPVPLPSPHSVVVTFVDADRGWALAEDPAEQVSGQLLDLYRTVDGGSSWARLPDPPRDAYYLALRGPTETWMGSLGAGPPHAYSSADAGRTWERHDLPPPPGQTWTSGHATIIQLVPQAGVLALTGQRTSPSVSEAPDLCCRFASFDSGYTWPYVPAPGEIAVQDRLHWWAIKDTALYKSSDAGQTWRRITDTLPNWQFILHVLDGQHAWAELTVFGGFGLAVTGLAFTNDGGLHWTQANVPQP